MNPSNKEVQLRKTCQLYAYVLTCLDKEVPPEVQECAQTNDFDYLIDCVSELSQTLKSFESETFERIVNNKESPEARELSQWWEMYQIYIPLD
ncbi:MAG: hypothetical protein OEW60_03940 [Thiovulaceae bacterium]|nr:hypothetical protein [Sulfurimonadaceae bacterium]